MPVHVFVCLRACVRACVRVCVRACVRVFMLVAVFCKYHYGLSETIYFIVDIFITDYGTAFIMTVSILLHHRCIVHNLHFCHAVRKIGKSKTEQKKRECCPSAKVAERHLPQYFRKLICPERTLPSLGKLNCPECYRISHNACNFPSKPISYIKAGFFIFMCVK